MFILNLSLYGIKQAPRAWYTRIDRYLIGSRFTKSEANGNLYHIFIKGKLFVIVLYVDDLVLARDEKVIRSCREDLGRGFKMKDMDLMHYFLIFKLWQGDGELFVSEGKYSNKKLQRFCMDNCKPKETPPTAN